MEKKENQYTASEIHKKYSEAVMAKDWEKVKSLLHKDYTYTGSDGKEKPGAEAALAQAQMYVNAFPDIKIKQNKVHVVGNMAIAEWEANGTHKGDLMGIAPTGKPIKTKICNVIEMRDGKIYREREYYDNMSIMDQLGVNSSNN